MTGEARPGLPGRREPDPPGLAAFTVDAAGLVTGWPDSAARLFGQPVEAVAGHDVCDVLLTGPGQRELVRRALAQVAAGRVWAATVAGGRLGEGRFAVRCEPLGGPVTAGDGRGTAREAAGDRGHGAMVLLRRAWPQPRPSWLAEAAGRIGGTLDLDQTACEVAEAAVPAFADAAVIYLAEHLLAGEDTVSSRSGPGMAVRRLAGRLAGEAPALVGSLVPPGEVIVFDPGTPGFRAMTTGQPVLFAQLDSQSAERIGRRPGGSQTVASYTSFLAVPLIARGTAAGCVMFGRTTTSPPFSRGELPHAGELASRAAVCIDNALLYHRERRTALALQQGLLPRKPDAPPGLEIASRYLPAGSSVVGGDWHDVIALSGGRAVIVVGDVMGHGPEAAAAMAQLRTAAHVLADLGLPPRQLLHRLDRMVAAITTAPFATCICAMIGGQQAVPGAMGRSCAASRAGHLPPVLVLPGGAAQVLDLPAGLPLGLGEESFEETTIGLPAGATLALYTDGLVESRAHPIDDGLAELSAALATALATPEATLDGVCEAVTQGLSKHSEDDITLLLARISR
jgi:GAF domain-containing protein